MKIAVLVGFAMLMIGLYAYAGPPSNEPPSKASAFPSAAEISTIRKQFAVYPSSGALNDVVRRHLNYTAHQKAGLVLIATTFMGGQDTVACYYELNQKDEAVRYRDVYDWAIQGGGKRKLLLGERNPVDKLLAAMPAGNPPATLKDLIVVTYFDGKRWNTRLYNQTKFAGDLSRIDPEDRKHLFTSSLKP